jgi:ABC-type Fe3+ transport system, periplasmic component
MAAQGEVLIGVSSPPYAYVFSQRKAPVESAIPSEGAAWDMEASALVWRGGTVTEEKQLALEALMNFSASREVSEIAAEGLYIPARIDVDVRPGAGTRESMIDMAAEQSALERDAVLREWRKRFEK